MRILCENPYNGGNGYTPKQVGELTPEQIIMLLMPQNKIKERHRQTVEAVQAAGLIDKDGFVRGRAIDGSEMKARIGGRHGHKALLDRWAAEQKAKHGN